MMKNNRLLSLWGLVLLATMTPNDVWAQSLNQLGLSKISTVGTSASGFEVRGLVRSSSRIEIRTDIVAPVASAPFLEGMSFAQNDILITFDCSRYKAELKAAKAGASAAWLEHKSKKRLLRHGAIGKDEVSLAAAKAVEASAHMDVQKARNIRCDFKAPFSGRVVELNTKEHEFPSSERPLMVIINDSALELEMVVPSDWLNWIKPSLGFEFVIDETGSTVIGQIERIGAEVDPVSQTIKIIGKIDNSQATVLSGMSGTAYFHGGS